jgi:hypothetical protein
MSRILVFPDYTRNDVNIVNHQIDTNENNFSSFQTFIPKLYNISLNSVQRNFIQKFKNACSVSFVDAYC